MASKSCPSGMNENVSQNGVHTDAAKNQSGISNQNLNANTEAITTNGNNPCNNNSSVPSITTETVAATEVNENGSSNNSTRTPERVIYKSKNKAAPSLNLGVWGKIPLHTLCDMYIDTEDGCMLTLSQAKMSRSIGGWVYDGAACLAKYLESLHYDPGQSADHKCMNGKRVIELGAGTGVVGIMAGYHGADAVITDMDNIVPLIDYNIEQNNAHLRGHVTAEGLRWGDEEKANLLAADPVDYLILANCVYYESSLEPLAETMKQLATPDTEVLVCYEERTQGIKSLIGRWHDIIQTDFSIQYLPDSCVCQEFKQDFVKLVRMKKL